MSPDRRSPWPRGRRLALIAAAGVVICSLIAPGGCFIKNNIDKALVTKRGLEAAEKVKEKAADGYDVRDARARWIEALHAYTGGDYRKASRLIESCLSLLASCNRRVADRVFYRSADGTMVSGLLFKPPGDGPWPLIVVAHAGFGEGADFSDVALMVRERGYVVFNPDFRGSGKSGGENEGAGGEVDDVISGIGHLKSLGVVRDDRVGVYGQSHGAAVAMLAAERYSGIKAVVEEAGFTDAVELYNMSLGSNDPQVVFLRDKLVSLIGGSPEQKPAEYDARSAIKGAGRMSAPVLLIHGARDPLIPVSQARRMYDALVAAGKTAELKIYPEEAHCVNNPAGRNEVFEMMFDWFRKYV